MLLLLRDVAFGRLIGGHIDLHSFFLPMDCFLGRSLASGHLPAWNPYVMLGAPFASDPQSGWMSLLPMTLFTAMPCGTALRWLIVLLPTIAGLGMYAFLRSEGLGRIAAAFGGASIALGIAGSRLAMSLPFSGSIAWTVVTLWSASRTMRARSWPSRLVWCLVTAIAWGQILGAHLSHGTIIGTAALLAFVVGRTLHDVRRTETPPARAIATLLALGAVLVSVNLAFLLPRFGGYPETTLSLGYQAITGDARASDQGNVVFDKGLDPGWIFKFATSPGLYAGAGILLFSFGGIFSRRLRSLLWSMGAFALICYLISLTAVFRTIAPVLSRIPLADQALLHRPWRYSLALVLALPILGAIGLQAWLEERRSGAARIAILASGAGFWFALPLLVGIDGDRLLLAILTAVVVAGVLVVVVRRPAVAGVLVLVVLVELAANGEVGRANAEANGDERTAMAVGPLYSSWLYAGLPNIDVDRYIAGSTFQDSIRRSGERFVVLGKYHGRLEPGWSPSLADQRAMLLRLEDVSGYNPVQLIRYWRFVREVNGSPEAGARPMKYNKTQLVRPSEQTLDLLDVGWITGMAREQARPAWTLAAREGRWALYRRPSPPRASVIGGWTVARGPDEALQTVVNRGFDPRTDLVLEDDPGIATGVSEEVGVARFRWLSASQASIDVTAERPGVVLIRNAYHPDWRATIDGEPTEILAADYLLQGVAVPAGHHVVRLAYEDPWIRRGLIGSGLAVTLVLSLAFVLARRKRSPLRHEPAGHALRRPDPEAGEADGSQVTTPASQPVSGSDA